MKRVIACVPLPACPAVRPEKSLLDKPAAAPATRKLVNMGVSVVWAAGLFISVLTSFMAIGTVGGFMLQEALLFPIRPPFLSMRQGPFPE
jgi:hypothetical protein